MEKGREIFMQGYRNGIPIGFGYFAVAFSLGIAARDYGFSALQGFFASLITYASAGQYMGFALYATNTTLAELMVLMFIINARYILMGFALNQRMPEGTPLRTRLLVGSCITDEIFGITIARPGIPTPYYTFGAHCSRPYVGTRNRAWHIHGQHPACPHSKCTERRSFRHVHRSHNTACPQGQSRSRCCHRELCALIRIRSHAGHIRHVPGQPHHSAYCRHLRSIRGTVPAQD